MRKFFLSCLVLSFLLSACENQQGASSETKTRALQPDTLQIALLETQELLTTLAEKIEENSNRIQTENSKPGRGKESEDAVRRLQLEIDSMQRRVSEVRKIRDSLHEKSGADMAVPDVSAAHPELKIGIPSLKGIQS